MPSQSHHVRNRPGNEQRNLDGEKTTEQADGNGSHNNEPKRGPAIILFHARADAPLAKIGAWVGRARAEGLLQRDNFRSYDRDNQRLDDFSDD